MKIVMIADEDDHLNLEEQESRPIGSARILYVLHNSVVEPLLWKIVHAEEQ